jgi:hypothetical protein
MTPHEWKVLGSFGLLLGAISIYDGKLAMQIAGVATLVILVKNANRIPLVGG